MINLEARVTTRLQARVADITVEPDLDDIVARAGQFAPEGRVSRRVVLGVAASLVAVAAGGLVVIGGRTDESPMPFGAEPPVDATDSYPIVDPESLLPDSVHGLSAGLTSRAGDQGWTGVVGQEENGLRSRLIAITVFPAGYVTEFETAEPGRLEGVMEEDFGDSTTLIWSVDGEQFTMVGDDRSTMYDLIGLIAPTEETAGRGGYELTGPLPSGYVETTEPHHRQPGSFPYVSTNDGRLNIEVSDEPPTVVLAASGVFKVTHLTWGSRLEGYGADLVGGGAILAIPITSERTLVVSSDHVAVPELLGIAAHVEFVDEQTWREFYHLDFECSGCDGMLTGPPVTPPTTD